MRRRSPQEIFTLVTIFSVLLIGSLLISKTDWNPWLVWFVSINLVTFAMYGYDKRQAQGGGLRAPEIILHGLALAGGFLGGWLGRSYFRHKTRKPVFSVILVMSSILWSVILLWVISSGP